MTRKRNAARFTPNFLISSAMRYISRLAHSGLVTARTPPLDTDERKRAFLSDIQFILARIADAGTPSTIHHLIELLDFLVPADPATVFDLVAHALSVWDADIVTNSNPWGRVVLSRLLATSLRIIVNCSLKKDVEKLIQCLDTFMEAGWPAARRLLYRLPELLQ